MTFNKFLDKAKKTAGEVRDSNTTAKILDQAQKAAHTAVELAGKAMDFSREKVSEALDSDLSRDQRIATHPARLRLYHG